MIKVMSVFEQSGFVDYYELLQISSNAELETIQRVFKMLAQRYRPDNAETGSSERLLTLTNAYETLSDPGQRLAYDRIYQQHENQPLEVFEKKEFVEGVKGEANRRLGILCLLYTRRRANPEDAGLSILEFESKMSFPREHLMFAVWYLQEQKLVRQEGNSDYVITGPGVDYVETRLTSNRILSRLIQAAALSDGHSPS